MRTVSLLLLLVVFPSLMSLNKKSIYSDLSSESESTINNQIKSLKKLSSTSEVRAFTGVFIMKSAQFEFAPWSKWNTFSKGKLMLEKEIYANSSNVEFRFLRLMIQENVPSVVMYSSDIDADAKIVKKNYKTLDKETQEFILKYSKKSDALKGLK
jgi:hypothetical protein